MKFSFLLAVIVAFFSIYRAESKPFQINRKSPVRIVDQKENSKNDLSLKSFSVPKFQSNLVNIMASAKEEATQGGMSQSLKLIIGAGGIYAAFLYYGNLQEDVFHYKAADGSKFTAAWFLQALGEFMMYKLYLTDNLSYLLNIYTCIQSLL